MQKDEVKKLCDGSLCQLHFNAVANVHGVGWHGTGLRVRNVAYDEDASTLACSFVTSTRDPFGRECILTTFHDAATCILWDATVVAWEPSETPEKEEGDGDSVDGFNGVRYFTTWEVAAKLVLRPIKLER